MKRILVTGGAGYIGSHAVLVLLEAGYTVSVIDNLSNGHLQALKNVEKITGRSVDFENIDLCDIQRLEKYICALMPAAVLHFAGCKAVNESVSDPLKYYQNNVSGTLNLLNVMQKCAIHELIFSSSATVYGSADSPMKEDLSLQAVNPYGRSKLMIEKMLCDVNSTSDAWKIAILRYFNPIGAHESGKIGEVPQGIPNNLMPFISQVASKKRDILSVFGNDYDTPDGTCIRDYIHVMDLVEGHLAALNALKNHCSSKPIVCNLGVGKGYSVLDLINTFEKGSGQKITYKYSPRRKGDVPVCFADTERACNLLKWKAQRNLEVMCADTWRWQSMNPNGYSSE